MISNPADEHGFQQYDFYLNNPCTKLTIEEFNQDNEIFVEVEPEFLWAEFDKESVYGKDPFFLLVTAENGIMCRRVAWNICKQKHSKGSL